MMVITASIFKNILSMTVAGGLSFLLIAAVSPLTKRLFSSRWHCRSLLLSLALFLVPAGMLGAVVPSIAGAVARLWPSGELSGFQDVWENLPAYAFTPDAAAVQPQAQSLASILVLPLACVWAVVALCSLVRKCHRLARFNAMLAKSSRPVDDISLLTAFAAIKKDMGIPRNVELLYNPCVATPMLTGTRKPKLILPDTSLDRLEAGFILRHELTHLKNRDLLVKALAALACSIHWFNPCAYILAKRLDTALELVCDAQVVSGMGIEQRKAYGYAILAVLERVSGSYQGLYAGLCEDKRNMKRRLVIMLNEKKPGKLPSALSAVVLAAVCIMGLTVSAYAYKAAPEPAANSEATDKAVTSRYIQAKLNEEINPLDDPETLTYIPLDPADESNPLDYQEIERPQTADRAAGVPDEVGVPQYTPDYELSEEELNAQAVPESFIWPTDGGWISVGLAGYPGHTGMDIVVPRGTPVYAAAAGVVVRSIDSDVGYGRYIIINHGGGYQTLYAHNDSNSVEAGDIVEQGQVIATVGRSGNTTGTNLHFEIRKEYEIKDPALYINDKNLPMEWPVD